MASWENGGDYRATQSYQVGVTGVYLWPHAAAVPASSFPPVQKASLQPDIRALEQKISFQGQKPTQEMQVSTTGAAAAVI